MGPTEPSTPRNQEEADGEREASGVDEKLWVERSPWVRGWEPNLASRDTYKGEEEEEWGSLSLMLSTESKVKEWGRGLSPCKDLGDLQGTLPPL